MSENKKKKKDKVVAALNLGNGLVSFGAALLAIVLILYSGYVLYDSFSIQVSALSAQQYVTIAAVMTISIMVGIWLVPLIGEKLLNGVINLENRDKKWGEIFSASMFIGMISAFIGYVFCDFSGVFRGETAGLIPVLVMTAAALVMTALGLASKKKGLRVLADYALPVSLIAGMAAAVPLTAWLG